MWQYFNNKYNFTIEVSDEAVSLSTFTFEFGIALHWESFVFISQLHQPELCKALNSQLSLYIRDANVIHSS